MRWHSLIWGISAASSGIRRSWPGAGLMRTIAVSRPHRRPRARRGRRTRRACHPARRPLCRPVLVLCRCTVPRFRSTCMKKERVAVFALADECIRQMNALLRLDADECLVRGADDFDVFWLYSQLRKNRAGFVYPIPLQMLGIGWRDRVCEPHGLGLAGPACPEHVQRRDRLGGLVHKYASAARQTGLRTPHAASPHR
jgi:hypothetical protein